MRLTRDSEENILYLRIREGEVHTSVDALDEPAIIMFDLDANGYVLGVEILDVDAIDDLEIPDHLPVQAPVQG